MALLTFIYAPTKKKKKREREKETRKKKKAKKNKQKKVAFFTLIADNFLQTIIIKK